MSKSRRKEVDIGAAFVAAFGQLEPEALARLQADIELQADEYPQSSRRGKWYEVESRIRSLEYALQAAVVEAVASHRLMVALEALTKFRQGVREAVRDAIE